MACWIIIPVKEPSASKTRLAGALTADARIALMRAMLHHVAATAMAARNVAQVCLVGPSRFGLPDDTPLLADPGQGLNAAVQSALSEAATGGATRVVIVAGDLPGLTVQELELLAAAPTRAAAIAPDRHGVGTNALSLPLPDAKGFSFAFGPDSFALHRAEADRLGLPIETISSPGLARDIDEPADLPDAGELLKPPG